MHSVESFMFDVHNDIIFKSNTFLNSWACFRKENFE